MLIWKHSTGDNKHTYIKQDAESKQRKTFSQLKMLTNDVFFTDTPVPHARCPTQRRPHCVREACAWNGKRGRTSTSPLSQPAVGKPEDAEVSPSNPDACHGLVLVNRRKRRHAGLVLVTPAYWFHGMPARLSSLIDSGIERGTLQWRPQQHSHSMPFFSK